MSPALMPQEMDRLRFRQTDKYQQAFDDYHERLVEILGSLTEINQKLSCLKLLIIPFDSLVRLRGSEKYLVESEKYRVALIVNPNNDRVREEQVQRIANWLALILEENPRFTLDKNLKKVDFNT